MDYKKKGPGKKAKRGAYVKSTTKKNDTVPKTKDMRYVKGRDEGEPRDKRYVPGRDKGGIQTMEIRKDGKKKTYDFKKEGVKTLPGAQEKPKKKKTGAKEYFKKNNWDTQAF